MEELEDDFPFQLGCSVCSMLIFRGVYGRDTLIHDTSWWFKPSHLKNMLVKLGSSSPIFGVNMKNLWNHHLVYMVGIHSSIIDLQQISWKSKGFLVKRTSWNFLFTVSILLSSLLQPSTSVSLASSYFQVNLVPYMVCRYM